MKKIISLFCIFLFMMFFIGAKETFALKIENVPPSSSIEEFPEFKKDTYAIKKGETIFLGLKNKNSLVSYESNSSNIIISKKSDMGCEITCLDYFENASIRVFIPSFSSLENKTFLTYKNEVKEIKDINFTMFQGQSIKISDSTYGVYKGEFLLSFKMIRQFPLLPYDKESKNILTNSLTTFFKKPCYCSYQKDNYFEYYIDLEPKNIFINSSSCSLKLFIDQGLIELNLQLVSPL